MRWLGGWECVTEEGSLALRWAEMEELAKQTESWSGGWRREGAFVGVQGGNDASGAGEAWG